MLSIPKSAPALGEIVTFKLVSGQELVGRCGGYDALRVTVRRPVEITMQMISPTQAGIAFAPFLASVDDDQSFTIERSQILVGPVSTRKDVAGQYVKATTGLTMPDQQATAGLIGL